MRSAWSIGKKGELAEVACRKKAHGERVTALVLNRGLLYSVSYDGCLKAWDAQGLDIVVDRSQAHGGERLHCCTLGPDGLLYTGGSDKVRRRAALGVAALMAVCSRLPGALGAAVLRAHVSEQQHHCLHSCSPHPCAPPTRPLQLVRRWDPQLMLPAAEPLLCHNHSVRTLAAGSRQLLVSGDKGGEVAVWKVA